PLGGGTGAAVGPPFAGALEGVRWILRQPFLRSLLLWLLGIGLVFNSIGLVILVAARESGASSAALGGMFAITAAGGLLGAVAAPAIVRRLPPRLVILTFGWLACGATFLLLPVRSPYVLGALGAVAFVLLPSVNAIAFGSVSEQAPEGMQGRATSAAIQI